VQQKQLLAARSEISFAKLCSHDCKLLRDGCMDENFISDKTMREKIHNQIQ